MEYAHFTVYKSYVEAYRMLESVEEKAAFADMLFNYGIDGKSPDKEKCPKIVLVAFQAIKVNIDNSHKRSAAGRIGGHRNARNNATHTPRNESVAEENMKQSASKPEANPKQTESKPEALAKQTESKAQANPKRTESKAETSAKQLIATDKQTTSENKWNRKKNLNEKNTSLPSSIQERKDLIEECMPEELPREVQDDICAKLLADKYWGDEVRDPKKYICACVKQEIHDRAERMKKAAAKQRSNLLRLREDLDD